MANGTPVIQAGAALALVAAQSRCAEAEDQAAATPTFLVPKLTGRQWIEQNLHEPTRCHENFRMLPDQLLRLHDILVTNHGLRGARETGTLESLAMFVWTCAQRGARRRCKDRFERSIDTISRKMTEVVAVFSSFADTIIVPFDQNYSSVHTTFKPYEPYFDGCIGALDGTHIEVIVNKGAKLDYINRKGKTSINVLGIVDMDMRFTFVGAGRAGSCHDASELADCWTAPNFPHPPAGQLGICGLFQLWFM